VAIGYLLARATDTVADTTALPLAERQTLLHLMTQAIAALRMAIHNAAHCPPDPSLCRATNRPARTRPDASPAAMPAAFAHPVGADQASVRQGAGPHHPGPTTGHDPLWNRPRQASLQTETELDDYTWLVAGCVGEFWTELCGRHLPGYSLLPQDEMKRIGREYGMGLQRLNIVRDMPAPIWQLGAVTGLSRPGEGGPDARRAGRSCTPTNGQAMPDTAAKSTTGPALHPVAGHTQSQLADGMRYALALKPLRLRLASALPALIGARTVALLREAGPAALTQRIKMPRHEVRALLWRIALGLGSAPVLQREFLQLSGQPQP
jgi:farnesyl-diphosphate farnesyltransferase